MGKPFFYRITAGDLMDFATDPESEGITLLKFAKELQKGQSDIPFIQSVINEAHNYIEKKKIAGGKGGKAKASSAKALLGDAKANPTTAIADSSIPLASSSSSSSNIDSKDKNKRFVPPSLHDVETYIKGSGFNVDAEKWINHYTAKGWKVGKTKMVDWQAAVRTWNRTNSVPVKPEPEQEPAFGTPERAAWNQKRLVL